MASLKDVASKMKVTFDINFLMNDGSKAAISTGKQNKTFSNCIQLRCSFQVKYNIIKRITKDYFPEMNEICNLKKISSGIKMLEIAPTNL